MKKILFSICILASTFAAKAQVQQGSSIFLVGWEIGIPLNNDYISETSWGGGYFDWRKFVKPNLSLGFAMSFNAFRQYVDTKTYVSDDQSTAVTTRMMRYQNVLPFMFNTCYYFKAMGVALPYVGLGVGAEFSDQWMYYSSFTSSNRDWGFVARPTVGAILRLGEDVGGHVGVGYNIAAIDNGFTDQNSIQYVYFQLGLSFYSR